MTRRFSMGVWLTEFVTETAIANGYTDAQLLTAVDDWKNALADELGLAHTDVESAHLYPSAIAIGLVLREAIDLTTTAPIGQDFPSDTLMDGLRDRGIRPVLYVAPAGIAVEPKWAVWSNWPIGTFDTWLDRIAKRAKSWANNANSTGLDRQGNEKDSTVGMRLAQEMNAPWWPYSIGKNGNTKQTFIAAWKYIHTRLITTNKAKNIRMFYCPYANRAVKLGESTMAKLYPGKAYVEDVGWDVYGSHTKENPSLKSMIDLYTPFYNEVRTFAPDKPIWIGETAVAGGWGNTDRQSWIDGSDAFDGTNAGGFQKLYDTLPNLQCVMWFDINNYALDQGTGTGPLHAYADAADQLSSVLGPEKHTVPFRDAWISHAVVDGKINYGNAATTRITVGQATFGTTRYKNRGLFGFSAAQMSHLLDSVPEFFTATLDLIVAPPTCAARGAAPMFFLEVAQGFDSLLADKNGHALTDCQLATSATKPKALWPGPTAFKTNRVLVDATGAVNDDVVSIDITDIIQSRIDNEDASALFFRLIAAHSNGTSYDEVNTARTISFYSSKAEGNEPNLKVRLRVQQPEAVSMSDNLALSDAMTTSANALFSVDGEHGIIRFKVQDQSNRAVLADVDESSLFIHTAFSIDKLPKGGYITYRLLARYLNASNYYEMRMLISPSGDLTLKIGKVIGGTETFLATIDSFLNVVKNQRYFARFYADDISPTFLAGKVWANGTTEPDPMLSVYDTTVALQTTGAIGLGGNVGKVTNLPRLLQIDEFWAAAL